MKKILFLFVVLISINFTSCSNIEPIVADVCEITIEICNYANLLCSQFNPELLSRDEQENLKKELLKVKNILESKVNQLNIQSELKKNSKDSYFELLTNLKKSVKEIDKVFEDSKEPRYANE